MAGIPETSVVIPLYNKVSAVARAVDSVLRQSYRNFELIIVDDGSTDGSGLVVDRYGDERILRLAQANAGPGSARNAGIRAARGKYLAFLDADDEWLPRFLERGVEELEAHPEAASVSFGYHLSAVDEKDLERRWRRAGLAEGPYSVDGGMEYGTFSSLVSAIISWTTVARADVVRRHGGFFDREFCLCHEDTYLWMQLAASETVRVLKEAHTIHHIEDSDLSCNFERPPRMPAFLEDPSGLLARFDGVRLDYIERKLAEMACSIAFLHALSGGGGDIAGMLRLMRGRKQAGRQYLVTRAISILPRTAGIFWVLYRVRYFLRHGRAVPFYRRVKRPFLLDFRRSLAKLNPNTPTLARPEEDAR